MTLQQHIAEAAKALESRLSQVPSEQTKVRMHLIHALEMLNGSLYDLQQSDSYQAMLADAK